MLVGAVAFGLTYRTVQVKIAAIANFGSIILPDLWHVSPYLLMAAFALACLFLFYLLEHGLYRKKEL